MTLIAHYRLDGNADDAFGKFNGVASNVTWAAGKLGQAASFDGSTSYIDSMIGPEIFRSDVSICMWANFLDDSRGILFGNFNNVGGFGVEKHTSNRLRVYFNGSFDYFTPNNVVTTGNWHHLTFVRDTKANQWRIYVDGALVGSTASVGAWVMAGMSTVWIGRDIRTGATTTYGSLDDVRIYDHALSVREVRDLAMGLAVHYPMSAKAQYYENLLRPENNAVNTNHPSYRPASGIAHGSWGASSEVVPPVEGVIVYKVVEDAVDAQNPRYGIRLNATDLALYDKDCILSYWVYLPSQYAGRYVSSEFVVCQNSTGTDWHVTRGYSSTFNFYGAGTILDQVIEGIDFGKLDQWQRIAVRFKPLTANIQLPENGGNDNNVWVAGYIRVNVSGAVSGGAPFHLYISGGQLVKSREAQDWTYGINQPVLRDTSKQGLDIELLETSPNWIEESPTGRGSYLFTNDATKRIDLPLVDLGSTLTYSCWAKQDSSEGHVYKFIVSSGRDITPPGVNVLSQSGVITVIYGGGPQGAGMLRSGVSVVGVWRHIVFTHDMVNGARLYVDGVLTATGPARTIDYSQANNRTVIGKMAYSYTSTASYFPFSGPISDVRFYASALTAEQVKELYQQRASLDSQGNFYAQMINEKGATKFQVTKAGQLSSQVSEVGITDGLVAYYPLNKDATDYSGNGYDGVANGAVPVAGGFDGKGAFGFDGVDDYIRATGAGINAGSWAYPEATFLFWIRPKQPLSASDQNLVAVENTFGIAINNSGPSSTLKYASTPWAWRTAPGSPVVTGEWTMIAYTHSTTSRKLFVNGVEVYASAETGGLGAGTPAYPYMTIGGRYSGPSAPYIGDLSALKIFNRALTAQEIAVEYKRTGPTKMTQHQGVTYIQGEIKEV